MKFPVEFYVFCFCSGLFFMKSCAEPHVKIWKPINDIFERINWVDPDSKEQCGMVEFAEKNTAEIRINGLTAEDYELPLTGEVTLSEGGSMKIVNHNSNLKKDCLKLKEINSHNFLNPKNWDSDVADNPAVPDREKLPCTDDKIRVPLDFSMLFPQSMEYYPVSEILLNNFTLTGSFESGVQALKRECRNPSGCICNKRKDIECEPSGKPECQSPVHPEGFCHDICGAFTTFKPSKEFSLKKMQESLKDYSDVYTHVSKVANDVIQVVFTEKKYSEDSVSDAEEFYEKLQKRSQEFGIAELNALRKSGSSTGGSSFVVVLLLSLFFVLGAFGLIFYVYGDKKWLTNLRFRTTTNFPLTSTYRARFSSRDDESGLIFDTQSLAGSVLNLRQSFDNPMFGEVSADKDSTNEEKNETCKVSGSTKEKPSEKNDPLSDLKKLNEELQEEIGSEFVEVLQTSMPMKVASVNEFPPLIEVEEHVKD